jgi:predicted dehydrogenase
MSLRVGVIGCGNISDIYLTNARLFPELAFVACADIRAGAAETAAARYGITALSVEQILGRDDINVILNLTVPGAHAEISLAALAAGKHVYSEKPLATTLADGRDIVRTAARLGLRVGAAPDTCFGAAVQTARRLLDTGEIGRPLIGLAAVLSHGMEHWHPAPDFFYKEGGGPVLDLAPYYIAALANLLGPVRSVVATSQIGNSERIITAPQSPFLGQSIQVETFTSVQTILEFVCGAQISFLLSWDVWPHCAPFIELHGTDGSLSLPDPSWFGGSVKLARRAENWVDFKSDDLVLGQPNYPTHGGQVANYRGVGLAEMARAIAEGRPHRASGELALHTLAVMDAIQIAASNGQRVAIDDTVSRPGDLPPELATALMTPQRQT